MRIYHDSEYGRVMTEDRPLFEKLCLEVFQAGLSWRTVLQKRDAFRQRFYGFNIGRVARMSDDDVAVLMDDGRIIRNRRKITAVIANAQAHMTAFPHDGDFVRYVYAQTDGAAMAADLKARGYRFVGPTICTSFLMSVGAISGHEETCFLYQGDHICPHT